MPTDGAAVIFNESYLTLSAKSQTAGKAKLIGW